MKTIIPAAKPAEMTLGKQKRREGVTYRLFKYVMLEPVDEGLLLYNVMTLELLLLTPEEADTMMESEELLARWFLVPEGHNDQKLASDLKAFAQSMSKPAKYPTKFKVFTTTHCNARCYYCFEQNFPNKKTMTPDTARQLVKYIADHCGGCEVSFEWFGGEPLVNQEAMDIVCQGLADAGISFHSVMVTNGYLIDKTVIRKAKELWRMTGIQITLDGTEEVYNRTKDYVNPQGSPFRRVMENIESLLDAEIEVQINLNVSEENWQDLMGLTDLLAERFGGRKGLVIYAYPLENPTDFEKGQTAGALAHDEVFREKSQIVMDRLLQLGLSRERNRLARYIRGNACVADSGVLATVLPDGALGFCGLIAEGETFGSVYSDERDEAALADWQERLPLTGPVCSDCLRYPECRILKKCPAGFICTDRWREYREQELRSQILNEYRINQEQQKA